MPSMRDSARCYTGVNVRFVVGAFYFEYTCSLWTHPSFWIRGAQPLPLNLPMTSGLFSRALGLCDRSQEQFVKTDCINISELLKSLCIYIVRVLSTCPILKGGHV